LWAIAATAAVMVPGFFCLKLLLSRMFNPNSSSGQPRIDWS
jgi:hypothetical protein